MNGNIPKISVIMNCYNSDAYLKEAIESVLSQTYKNFEIIFWDNQSIDDSAKIVKSYQDDRIKYFYAPKFTPLGEARNLAIEKATGEWIAFLDSDDLWKKDKLKVSISTLNSYKFKDKVSLIYTKSIMIDKNSKQLTTYDKCITGDIWNILLKEGNFIVQSSIIIKKDVFYKVGGINSTLTYCPDYNLLLKVTKSYQALGIDEFLTFYRVHENNITSTKVFENNIEVIEMLNNYIKNNKVSFYVQLNVFLNNSYRIGSLFMKLLINKEFKKIKFILKEYFLYLLAFPMAIIKVKV